MQGKDSSVYRNYLLGHIMKHQPPQNGMWLVALFHDEKDVDTLLAVSLGLSDANATHIAEPLPSDRAVAKVAMYLEGGYGEGDNNLYKDYLDAYMGRVEIALSQAPLDKIAAALIGLQDRKGQLKTAKALKATLKSLIPS